MVLAWPKSSRFQSPEDLPYHQELELMEELVCRRESQPRCSRHSAVRRWVEQCSMAQELRPTPCLSMEKVNNKTERARGPTRGGERTPRKVDVSEASSLPYPAVTSIKPKSVMCKHSASATLSRKERVDVVRHRRFKSSIFSRISASLERSRPWPGRPSSMLGAGTTRTPTLLAPGCPAAPAAAGMDPNSCQQKGEREDDHLNILE